MNQRNQVLNRIEQVRSLSAFSFKHLGLIFFFYHRDDRDRVDDSLSITIQALLDDGQRVVSFGRMVRPLLFMRGASSVDRPAAEVEDGQILLESRFRWVRRRPYFVASILQAQVAIFEDPPLGRDGTQDLFSFAACGGVALIPTQHQPQVSHQLKQYLINENFSSINPLAGGPIPSIPPQGFAI